MTYIEKYLKENSDVTREEVINDLCPSVPFVDENMKECINYCGIEKGWCKRCWEVICDE